MGSTCTANEEAYLKLMPIELKLKKAHDDEVKLCDEDSTKTRKGSVARAKEPTVQRKYVEKDAFDWGPEQRQGFDKVKHAICTEAYCGTYEEKCT